MYSLTAVFSHAYSIDGGVFLIVQLHDQHVHKSQEGDHVTIAMESEGGSPEAQQLEAESGSGSWGWSSFKSLLPLSQPSSSPDKALSSPLLQQVAHSRPPRTGTQVCVCVCMQCSASLCVLCDSIPPLHLS